MKSSLGNARKSFGELKIPAYFDLPNADWICSARAFSSFTFTSAARSFPVVSASSFLLPGFSFFSFSMACKRNRA